MGVICRGINAKLVMIEFLHGERGESRTAESQAVHETRMNEHGNLKETQPDHVREEGSDRGVSSNAAERISAGMSSLTPSGYRRGSTGA